MKQMWLCAAIWCYLITGCNTNNTEQIKSRDPNPQEQTSEAAIDKKPNPEKLLQGRWIAVRGEAAGEPTLLEGYSFIFEDGRFTAGAPHATTTGKYEINTSKDPMQITFLEFGLGIFKFEDDELYLCIDSENRPTVFSTSESSHEILTICKKAK